MKSEHENLWDKHSEIMSDTPSDWDMYAGRTVVMEENFEELCSDIENVCLNEKSIINVKRLASEIVEQVKIGIDFCEQTDDHSYDQLETIERLAESIIKNLK